MHPPHPAPADRLDLMEHADWARGLARALVPDAAAAEDITQDALALALVRPAQADPKSWLAGTLRNLALQRRRKEARRARREREAAQSERLQDHTSMLGELEAKRRLMEHVMALGERNREILLLRYVRGETPRAIAVREGRTVASVSNQLTRAHASLRQRLEADGGAGAWLSALVPLLGKRTVGWGAASEASATVGTGSFVTMAWTIGKAVLAIALVGTLWAILKEPSVPTIPMVVAAQSHPLSADDVSLAGGAALAGIAPDRARRAQLGGAPAGNSATAGRPTGSLTAQLLDSAGAPVSDATLSLQAWRGSPLEAITDDQGYARWDSVPAGADLAVALELDGRRWHDPIASLQLEPEEDAKLAWSVHVASVIRGVAVDEGGARLPGQPLQLLAQKEESPMFGFHPSNSDVYATTVTDEAGRFVFPRQMAGRYTLFPARRPSEFSKNFMSTEEVKAAEALIELFEGKTEVAHFEVCFEVPYNVDAVDVDATFYTGGAISGRTASAATGSPIPGKATLILTSSGHRGPMLVETDEEGRFVTPPLPPGQYEIAGFRGAPGTCPAEPIPVMRGADDVRVPLLEAVAVEIRAEFPPGVDPPAGALRVEAPMSRFAFFNSGYHRLEAGETEGEVSTLRPGGYGFLYMADDGSFAGSVPPMELGPGRLPGGIVIPVVPAARVTITNSSSDTNAEVTCCIDKMRLDSKTLLPGATVSLPAPPGNVTVIVKGPNGQGERSFALHAISGETATVNWE